MAVGLTRDVSQHTSTYDFTTNLERSGSEYFAPPVPVGMQEPGTNYLTIVTADGPHTLEKPGITGGITLHANNNTPSTGVAPLTRKGG